MMHADGELKPAEEQELMSFLFDNPELQQELAAFSMSKLIPDTELIYDKKAALLKPVPGKKAVPFPNWKRYAIAAGVAAILFISFYKFTTDTDDTTPVIAATETVKPAATATPGNEATAAADPVKKEIQNDHTTAPVTTITTVQQNTTRSAHAPKTTSTVASVKEPRKGINQWNIPQTEPSHPIVVRAVTKAFEDMQPTEITAYNNEKTFSPEPVTNVPALAIQIQEEGETPRSSLIDRLPIDDLKKKGMENFATAMANGYDKVNALRQEISESTVSLKIEKRKLIVSF